MDVETILNDAVKSDSFKKPAQDQKIFKDECAYCFKTPLWKDGLFISLKNYHAFCREHSQTYSELTGHNLYVQIESTKVPVDERSDGEPTTKMTKLTIDADPKFELEDKYCVVVHPNYDQQVFNVQGCQDISDTIQKIASTTSAERLALLSSSSNAWDGDIKLITKHANLVQHDDGKQLARSGWTCEVSDCGLQENLWLNLTDGAIRCGRSQFVSEGVKTPGNGHMQDYFDRTRFPLVVKLGTISSDLDAIDVYSYDEGDAVIDPNIIKHLKHFGLDAFAMVKTAKSTMEMELDMNEKWEWAKCTEDGVALEPIYGPGYTGLVNTGSSCYMNSVLQALLEVDSFRTRYGDRAAEIFSKTSLDSLSEDFNAQFAKVIKSMMSGDYSNPTDTSFNNIKPLIFKKVAAGRHVEFSTAKQQDVEEYIRFLFEKITQESQLSDLDPTESFRFQTWTRFEDVASQKVRYTEQEEILLRLPIPENIIHPIPGTERVTVDMEAALRSCFDIQFVDGYKSPITGEQKGATNTVTMKTFPDYLFVQVQKFAFCSTDGSLKKLDLDFEVSEELNLSAYRGHGITAEEEALPEDAPTTQPPPIPAKVRQIANQLMAMGFGEDACLRAAFCSNGTAEVATNWLMENMDDPHLNDKFVMPGSDSTPSVNDIDPNMVQSIVEMGFTEHQAKYALKQVTDVAGAVDWLFNNLNSIPEEGAAGTGQSSSDPEPSVTESSGSVRAKHYKDGGEKYKLIGMISHMGSRPDSGHYVSHILKDGKWVLFNDEKVALSQDPPKKLAYIYMYKRV